MHNVPVLRRSVAGLAIGAMLVLMTACGTKQQPWALKNITGLMPDLSFQLTRDDGKPVTAADYRGTVSLLYFGYTHCPDVCPLTLGRLAQALHRMGADAQQVRVLFVSVDPARDTLQVLHQYVKSFGPEFVGLRGPDTELRRFTKRYRVTYGRDKPDSKGNYQVSHSSAVFIFDKAGKIRLLSSGSDKASAIAEDLKRLVAEKAT